ncbi:MAG: hypothetical protein AAFW89_12095 [Bacteroidota bacterium]
MKKLIGNGLALVGLFGFLYFGISFFELNSNFNVFAESQSVNLLQLQPLAVSVVVFVVGLFVLRK